MRRDAHHDRDITLEQIVSRKLRQSITGAFVQRLLLQRESAVPSPWLA
jgi:hypothetical protein